MTQPNCPICKTELSPEELYLNQEWHDRCAVCVVCGNVLHSDIIISCLKSGQPLRHAPCAKLAIVQELRDKTLPLFREHLAVINESITGFHHTLDGKISDVELLAAVLSEMKVTGANVRSALEATKDKIKIRDNEEWDTKQKAERAIQREVKIKKETAKIEREEKSEMFAKERQNPALRNRRKAIAALTEIGWSLADATAQVQKQMGIDENGDKIQ